MEKTKKATKTTLKTPSFSTIIAASVTAIFLVGVLMMALIYYNSQGNSYFFDDYAQSVGANLSLDRSTINIVWDGKSSYRPAWAYSDRRSSYPTAAIVSKTMSTGKLFYAIRTIWTASNDANVKVEISTDGGRKWCIVGNGQGIGSMSGCVMPSASFKYRVTFVGPASMGSIRFNFDNNPPASVSPSDHSDSLIGMNLEDVAEYSASWLFVDLMKRARPFFATSQDLYDGSWEVDVPVPTRADGYPLKVPFSTPQGMMAARTVIASGGNYPAGTYTLVLAGSGKVELSGDSPTKVYNAPGTYQVSVTPQDLISLRILTSSQSDPVRDIRFIAPGFANSYQQETFHPKFIESLRNVGVIRFMDWGRTNNSSLVHWSQRSLPTYFTQDQPYGVAVEHMVDLANKVGADMWVCVPHQASDDYVRNLAVLIKGRLDPARRVYVEYSNEVWNGQFEQMEYAKAKGIAMGFRDAQYPDDYQAAMRYYSYRSTQIFDIFQNVFGGASRVVRVLSSQSSVPNTSNEILSFKDAYQKADALAIAPYFGNELGEPEHYADTLKMSVSQIFNHLYQQALPLMKSEIAAQKAVADRYGIGLVAYEAGQHLAAVRGVENNAALVKLLHDVNRDPRMEAVYDRMFENWFGSNPAGMMVLYLHNQQPTKFGNWGIMEGQNDTNAPKYRSVMKILAEQAP